MARSTTRGLVIGGGAALGGAWAVGALHALCDVEGFEPSTSDVVVGTSAGSVLAAMIALEVTPEQMAQRMSGAVTADVEETAPVNPFNTPDGLPDHVHHALAHIPRPIPLPGNLLLAARTVGRPTRHTLMTAAAGLAPRGRGSLAPVGDLIAELRAELEWPTRPRTWITAVDFDSGERVVFGRPDAPAATLPEAVVASCAAPGFFPPVPIGDHRYVDGGAFSVTNADVLLDEDLDEVLILAPMAMYERDHPSSVFGRLERRLRGHFTRRLSSEVTRLAAAGASVRVLGPTAEDLAAMGDNVMNPRRRHDVYETALRTTRARLLHEHAT